MHPNTVKAIQLLNEAVELLQREETGLPYPAITKAEQQRRIASGRCVTCNASFDDVKMQSRKTCSTCTTARSARNRTCTEQDLMAANLLPPMDKPGRKRKSESMGRANEAVVSQLRKKAAAKSKQSKSSQKRG